MQITIRKNGVDYPVEAPDMATARARVDALEKANAPNRSTGEQITRDVKSGATGVRQFGESMAGIGGDAPGMVEGATEYIGHKLQQLPLVGEHIPESAVQGAGQAVNQATTNLNPLARISQVLQAMGVIGPDTPVTPAMINPTSQDIHGAVSSVLPQSVQEATTYQPTNTQEKVSQFLGNFLPGMATGTSELSMAENVPAMLKALTTRFGSRVAAPTAALTGTEAATDKAIKAGFIKPEDATAINIVVGALSAAPGAAFERGAAVKTAASQVTRNPQALKVVYESLSKSGLSPEGALARLKDYGVDDTMLADLSHNMKQLGLVASSAPGTGREELHGRLEARHAQEGETIKGIREEATGVAPNRFTVEAEIKAAKDRAAEGYEPAYAGQQRPAATQHLVDELDTKLGRAKDEESRTILNKIKNTFFIQDSLGTAKPHLDPSVEGLHSARIALRRMLEKAENRMGSDYSEMDAGLIRSYLTKIDNEIGSVSPQMKAVDVAFSKEAAHTKAFELGEEALKKGEGALNLSEFQQKLAELPPEAKSRITEGLAHKMELTLDRPNEKTAMRSYLGGGVSEDKLREIIGPEKMTKLLKELENVDIKHDTYQKIVKGTKAVDQPKAEPGVTEGALATGAATALYTGSAPAGIMAGVTKTAVNFLRDKLAGMTRTQADAKLKSDIASLLASRDPESILKAAAKVQKITGKSALPSAMLNALVARRAGGPR